MEASVLPGMRSSISLRQVVQIAQLSHTNIRVGWAVETPPCISVDVDRY